MSSLLPYKRRLKVVLSLFGLGLFLIIFRLAQLQVVEADFYRGRAVARRIKRSLVDSTRGTIFDANGTILAYDRPSFDIAVQFQSMATFDRDLGKYTLTRGEWMESVSRLSGIPISEAASRAEQIINKVQLTRDNVLNAYRSRHGREPPRSYRIPEELSAHAILTNVDFETMAWAEVASEHFPGIFVRTVSRRAYPFEDMAAHIIGFMGLANEQELKKYGAVYDGSPAKKFITGDRVGRMGIEERYNPQLRGERGELIAEVDAKGRRQKVVFERLPIPGDDAHSTIETELQQAAEDALGKQTGAFIVLNPENGQILAMASYPRFNPNTLSADYSKLTADPLHPFLHRATQGLLASGSVFKIATVTAGLESRRISPYTKFTCEGTYWLRKTRFTCWHKGGHGELGLEQAIEHSCNVYFYNAAGVIEAKLLLNWAKRFGLGSKTGIDIAEETGRLPRCYWTGDVCNLAVGQGNLLVTPIQVARMVAVVANGGKLVKPHVIERVTNAQGKTVLARTGEHGKDLHISPSTIKFLRNALRRVVVSGTVSHVADAPLLQQWGVAAKSGTAQTADEEVNHAWLAGFVPFDSPETPLGRPRICFVILAERVPGFGGETCAPLLKKFLEYYYATGPQVVRR